MDGTPVVCTPVDLLINNAGIYGTKSARGEAMEEFYGPDKNDLEPEEWLKVMHVNAIAPMILTTALLPSLRLADQPVIRFISTIYQHYLSALFISTIYLISTMMSQPDR